MIGRAICHFLVLMLSLCSFASFAMSIFLIFGGSIFAFVVFAAISVGFGALAGLMRMAVRSERRNDEIENDYDSGDIIDFSRLKRLRRKGF